MIQDVFSLLRPNEGRRQETSFGGLSSLLASSTAPALRTEPIGVELRHLVDTLSQSGRDLRGIAEAVLAGHIQQMLDRMSEISCRIAMVGQVKAGKSSFINALMQRGELLPTHVNPWTAVATKLHFGTPGRPVTGCDFTFFTAEEWANLGVTAREEGGADVDEGFREMMERAEVRLGENFEHLLGKTHFYQSVQPAVLQNYLCAGPPVEEISRDIRPGRYADITKSANVYFPLPPLAVPAILIDTPGTNDPTHLRLRITREIIEGADIYIVVLTARQPLAGSDLGLLKLLRGLEKKRIIVFINRIDELSDRAGSADLILKHVKDELQRVLGGASIPVVAGSAKWAGLSGLEDVEALRRESQSASLQAFNAQRDLPIPAQTGQESDVARLQDCFRAASGIETVSRLLSLYMLSGFLSNHAKAIAEVLLSAADITATTALSELQTLIELIDTMQADSPNGAGSPVAGAKALIKTIDDSFRSLNESAGPAIKEGILRLESALEGQIQRMAEPQKPVSGAPEKPSTAESRPEPVRPAAEVEPPAAAADRSDWLASVKELTFEFLRKALADTAPAKPAEPRPVGVRPTSLTVPITSQGKEIPMNSGSSWWPEWSANRRLDARKAQELSQIVSGEFGPHGPDSSAAHESFQDLLENSVRGKGLTTIAPLSQLAASFRALQAYAAGRSGESNKRMADFIAQYDRTINDACRAIAIAEHVTRQLKAVFTPPAGAGS